MNIRPLVPKDRVRLHSMLIETRVFSQEEIDVAMELIDIVLKDENQNDYRSIVWLMIRIRPWVISVTVLYP